MKKIITQALGVLFCVFALPAAAQDSGQHRREESKVRITGKVVDQAAGTPVEYATIALFSLPDSALSGGTITDAAGLFTVDAAPGAYYARIEFIAYRARFIPVKAEKSNAGVNLGTIAITAAAVDLGAVEVEAEKNQVQMTLDKKIFNVGQDLSAIGGAATDVLDNIPSVEVDMEGNVSLRGSQNVRILINGKPSALTGISSTEALRQLPAGSIERVEVITNPSARYDAEGMAGIINIILKKDSRKGFNGMAGLSLSAPDDHRASFNFNYGRKRLNFFGNASANYSESPITIIHDRIFTFNDTTTFNRQEGKLTRTGFSYGGQAGVEWSVTDRNQLTLAAGTRISERNNDRTTTYSDFDQYNVLTDFYKRFLEGGETDRNADVSAAWRRTFTKAGRELSASLSYSAGLEDEEDRITEQYYNTDLSPSVIPPLEQRSGTAEKQSNLTFQADYLHPFAKEGRFETGFKSSKRVIDNDYDIDEYSDSIADWLALPYGNHFTYDELINAGYVILGNKTGKFSYQAGLRMEMTWLDSRLRESGDRFYKEYTNFFPSIHLSREFGKEWEGQLSYSKRVRRPHFRELNPFHSFSDPLNLWIGNPAISPEFTHAYEISAMKYFKKSSLTASLYYRHADGLIQRLRSIDTGGVSVTRPENLGVSDSYGTELTYSADVRKGWKVNGSVNYYREVIPANAILGTETSDAFAASGRVNTTVKLWKGIEMQVMFNYRGPQQNPQGTRKAHQYLDTGFRKEIMKTRGSLAFKVTDIFDTRKYRGETVGDGFTVNSSFSRWTRTFVLEFSYKFNNYKAKPKKDEWDGERGGDEGGF